MNEQTIVGNLTRDPEVHVSAKNARTVTTFDVAVNRRRFDRETGEWIEQTPVFHRVVTYGQLADNAAESLRRGIEVAVIGRFADDSYTAEDGTRRVRIVLEAEVVAPSLRWAIARPMKVSRDAGAPAEVSEEMGA
ncbi:single-stranded DNA-binding protein [Amycolatopsis sp. K13G38]|uniref:Single-stranded DNA-binding protein n=1 Tax=Amycolatopsis acididurans TaxID=2724524 RepID=A0ABX1JHF1_9PSEU|nr:single-stranded DNA-binding protein [Amycolatopsis acididurans]NKQ59033.1 single-stranded DNA-binding protein [Amycolatopsis acididurans]